MKKFVLAAVAVLTLGMSVASASPRIGDGANASPTSNVLTYGVGAG